MPRRRYHRYSTSLTAGRPSIQPSSRRICQPCCTSINLLDPRECQLMQTLSRRCTLRRRRSFPLRLPCVHPRSVVDQVGQFQDVLAPKPAGAEWDSSNSLFAFWIGINDIVMPPLIFPYMYGVTHVGNPCREIRMLGYGRFAFARFTNELTSVQKDECHFTGGLPPRAYETPVRSGRLSCLPRQVFIHA